MVQSISVLLNWEIRILYRSYRYLRVGVGARRDSQQTPVAGWYWDTLLGELGLTRSDDTGKTGTVAFLPVLATSLLPLVGLVALGWGLTHVAMVYLLDTATMFIVYGVVALFAERSIVLDEREIYLPGVSRQAERAEKWNREPNGVQLTQRLPPIYPRNIRLVVMSLIWGFGMVGVAASVVPDIIEYAFSVPVVLTALSMVGSRLYTVSREYFGERHYERYSVHEVLEIPGRLLAFAACYLAVVVVLGGFALLVGVEILSEVGVTPDIDLAFAFGVAIVAGKVVVEWSRFQAENNPDPSGLAAWFHPKERSREDRHPHSEEENQHGDAHASDAGREGWRSKLSPMEVLFSALIVYLLLGAVLNGQMIIAVLLGLSLVSLLWGALE